ARGGTVAVPAEGPPRDRRCLTPRFLPEDAHQFGEDAGGGTHRAAVPARPPSGYGREVHLPGPLPVAGGGGGADPAAVTWHPRCGGVADLRRLRVQPRRPRLAA